MALPLNELKIRVTYIVDYETGTLLDVDKLKKEIEQLKRDVEELKAFQRGYPIDA